MTNPIEALQPPSTLSNWSNIWTAALARPSLQTFADIAKQPENNLRRGVTWVFIAAAAAAAIGAAYLWLNAGLLPSTALFAGFVVPLVCVLWLLLTAGSAHLIARLLGGSGHFDQLVGAFAASSAPLTILTILVFILPGMFRPLLLVLASYGLILNWLALRVVHGLTPGRAFAAITPIAVIVILIPVAAVVIILVNLAG
jgi:hypothetical protein